MKKINKLFVGIALVSLMFSLSAPLVYADSFSLSDPKGTAQQAMQGIMEMMGADQTATKNMVQAGNVLAKKGTPPQVTLTFTPSSPVPGTTVTATTAPTYFLNDPSQLYYTWFLKHDYCKDSKKGDSDYNEKCDLDNDDKVNIEDYKIDAMRTIVNAGFEWQKADYSKSTNDAGYKAILGGQDRRGMHDYCYVHNFTTGDDFELPECKHLFPDAPGEKTGDGKWTLAEEKFWHTNPNSNDTGNLGSVDEATVSGLGKTAFSWLYQTGDKVGVAVEGVSVAATTYADSSYRIMWALPKNNCDVTVDDMPADTSSSSESTAYDPLNDDKIVTTTTTAITYTQGDYTLTTDEAPGMALTKTTTVTVNTKKYRAIKDLLGNVTGYEADPYYDDDADPTETSVSAGNLSVSTTIDDLNDCLESNMVEPAEGNSNKKIEVELSYLPDSPINDLTDAGSNSDTLVLQSSILNADNKEFVNYAWQISLGDQIGTDDWKELPKSDLTEQTGLKQTMGIGLRSIQMRLNFKKAFLNSLGLADPNIFYLRARLDASENISSDFKKTGMGLVIIPIHLSSSRIQVFSTNVSADLKITPDLTGERCNSGTSSAVCPVAKDEIVSLKAALDPNKYDLMWTLNGENLPYQGDCSGSTCDSGKNYSNVNYFPVLQEKGSRYTVTLNASHKKTGEKISLTKIFEVVEPSVTIVSSDTKTAAPVLLGNYVDLDNKLWPDYSADTFEALQGTDVALKPIFNTPFSSAYSWFVDGSTVTDQTASELGVTLAPDGTLSFPADKPIGGTYNISIGALYTQPNLTKKALNKYWEVSLADFYEKQIGQSIDVKVTDLLSGSATANAGSLHKKVLASLFSEIPAYVNFLFRIVLTTALILFATGIIFSVFPRQSET